MINYVTHSIFNQLFGKRENNWVKLSGNKDNLGIKCLIILLFIKAYFKTCMPASLLPEGAK